MLKRMFIVFPLVLIAACGEKESEQKDTDSVNQLSQSDSAVSSNALPAKKTELASSWARKFYEGQIDGKYKIYVSLKNDNGALSGKYYYDSQRKLLDVSGRQVGDSLLLKESYKSKITGYWDVVKTGVTITGEWKNKKNTFTLKLTELSDSTTFYSLLNESKANKTEIESFEKFISWFETKQLPFTIDKSVDEGKVSFDTTSVQVYLEPGFVFEGGWGFNEFEPVFKYETDFGYVLGVHQFYTPGAFGIYNTYFNVYTFDKDGKQLDSDEIACFCYDSNLGANDYYQTEAECRFMDGQIEVDALHTHANLFDYQPGDADYDPEFESFMNQNEESYTVLIDTSGNISVPER